jgi:hypothetical protein
MGKHTSSSGGIKKVGHAKGHRVSETPPSTDISETATEIDWTKVGSGINPFGRPRDQDRRVHRWLLTLNDLK